MTRPRSSLQGDEAEKMLAAVVETLRLQDEPLADQLTAGNLSPSNLQRAEELLANLLVQTGFDSNWRHNERGRRLEQLIGWVVSWKAEREQ